MANTQDVPIDLTGPARSVFPTDVATDPPKLAQASIGQNDTEATPLQMALVSAGVANHGTIMTPHVMRDVRNSEGVVVKTYEPSPWLTPLEPDKAETLKQDLYGPVNDPRGTAFGLHVQGYKLGGKTGTAQVAADKPGVVEAWFTGFAGPENQDPQVAQVAVAAVVLNQGPRDINRPPTTPTATSPRPDQFVRTRNHCRRPTTTRRASRPRRGQRPAAIPPHPDRHQPATPTKPVHRPPLPPVFCCDHPQ